MQQQFETTGIGGDLNHQQAQGCFSTDDWAGLLDWRRPDRGFDGEQRGRMVYLACLERRALHNLPLGKCSLDDA